MASADSALNVSGPIAAADATWRTGVNRVALTGANQTETLPTTNKASGRSTTVTRRWIRVLAMGANAQFAFGIGAAPTLVARASGYSAGGPPKTPNVGAGMTLLNGSPEQFLVPQGATHFAVFGDGGATGDFEWVVNDQPIP